MKTYKLKTVGVLLSLGFFIHSMESKAFGAPEVISGEFVVKVKKASMQNDVLSLFAKTKQELAPNVFLVKSHDEPKLISELNSKSELYEVEPNYIYRAQSNQMPWQLKNTGQSDCSGARGNLQIDVRGEDAWAITKGAKNLLVAVIDSGVDVENPRIKNQIVANAIEAAGLPGVDDDNNGYIDDVYGYDFVEKSGAMQDRNGHGTFCAGEIVASPSEGDEVMGLAPGVSILPVRFLDETGAGTLADAVKAIDYAVSRGAKVLSNSWGGGGYSKILEESIRAAEAKGVLFVAAAGNSAQDNNKNPVYPASYQLGNIIAVASINNAGALANTSNFGGSTHIAAPGVNVLGLDANQRLSCSSGTSMATPLVAATAGLMLSKEPKLSVAELKARILSSVTPLESLNGKVSSGGMLNTAAALKAF